MASRKVASGHQHRGPVNVNNNGGSITETFENVAFARELQRVLPAGVPNREALIGKGALHLQRVAEANSYMNLTRILNPAEAAVKHVYDSVAPWEVFRGAQRVLDAGTGAGFPGVPLSVVLPETSFVLAESIQKKARFVSGVASELQLANVEVVGQRAEQVVETQRFDVITARAVAPLERLFELFRKGLKSGARLILYKGPEVETELREAPKHRVKAVVRSRYELPDGLGTRTIVEVQSDAARARIA